MALAFMLNPARRAKKKRRARGRKHCLTAKQLRALARGRSKRRSAWGGRRRSRRKPSRRAKAIAGKIHVAQLPGEGMRPSFVLNNPRKKRRGRKGGRSMATKKRKRRSAGRRRGWTKAKRVRAGRKAWRKRLRRYPKKRSSVGRRGYKNNPRRRKHKRRRNPVSVNPRRRRRRNPLAVRGMYSNPRRRHKRRRNPSRSRRRRNPFNLGGTFNAIKSRLMNPESLMQFAAAAAGGTVSSFGGAWLAGKIAGLSPSTFPAGSTASQLLNAATTIASAVILGGFLPSKFQTAFILGGGAFAAKPLVDMALAPALAQVGAAAGVHGMRGLGGISGWISVNQVPQIGMAGMRGGVGAWISAQQMANGFRGLRGGLGDAYSFSYGTPVGSLEDYSRQPYAGSGTGPDSAFSQ